MIFLLVRECDVVVIKNILYPIKYLTPLTNLSFECPATSHEQFPQLVAPCMWMREEIVIV